ncbi:Retron-type RNA-directed DNA polymerase, partial [Bathymodiolus heckerae thiotrophic gill symbiont]
MIQQAIAQVLTPIFDPEFSPHSFGFRPGRNGQQAVKQIQNIIKTGRRIAVDVYLLMFFDRVNHDLLMTHLGYKVQDKRLLKLISACTKKPFLENTLLYLTEYFLNFDSALQKTHQLLRVFII